LPGNAPAAFSSPDLKLYAVLREDLGMSTGKAASQAGHAYLQALMAADPARQAEYHRDGLGTKVCLLAANLRQLLTLHHRAKELGLPCALIEDTGRNTTFNGVPTISAVGIGPLSPDEAKLLRRFPLCP
jgi:peptidyl-tRNA hydrolase